MPVGEAPHGGQGLPYAARVATLSIRDEVPLRLGTVSLAAGDAFPPQLPDLTDVAVKALTTYRAEALQYGPRAGLPELRRWVANYVGADEVRVTPEQVLIVNGAKHGLDLICKLFLDPGDAVLVTSPTYQSALGIFRAYQAEFVRVGQDAEGLDLDDLEDELGRRQRTGRPAPKLLYNVFEFHNPTGVTVSAQRRQRLVELAGRYGFLVVEDDPYRCMRFEGVPVRPVQSWDEQGRVIGLGTFAKIVAPGLRVGWVTATTDVVRRMASVKSDGGSCPLTQRMIFEYCRSGYLEPHVHDLAKTYGEHRDQMLDRLAHDLPEATATRPQGGYYLWVRLAEDVNTEELLPLAARSGVRYLPGSLFYPAAGPVNYLRLAYSFSSPSEIAEGIARLAGAVRELRRSS
jgi:2-aminoadipate transaminase